MNVSFKSARIIVGKPSDLQKIDTEILIQKGLSLYAEEFPLAKEIEAFDSFNLYSNSQKLYLTNNDVEKFDEFFEKENDIIDKFYKKHNATFDQKDYDKIPESETKKLNDVLYNFYKKNIRKFIKLPLKKIEQVKY